MCLELVKFSFFIENKIFIVLDAISLTFQIYWFDIVAKDYNMWKLSGLWFKYHKCYVFFCVYYSENLKYKSVWAESADYIRGLTDNLG